MNELTTAVGPQTLVLGIETSCDETAAALVMGGGDVVASVVSSQIDLHVPFGGVVPEIASRAHLDLLNPVIARAIVEAGVDERRIDAVACTVGPGLIGALLVGVSAAKALALAWDIPFVGVNHLEAHLYAALLDDPTIELPIVVLLVSGGHTLLVEMREPGRYQLLGQTIDDAAGEAFDKVARFLGLGYPGGPAIERVAAKGDPEAIDFPRAMRNEGFDFSFSGLKTSVMNHVRANPDVDTADVAASFQAAVVDVLVHKARRAAAAAGAKGPRPRRRRRRQLVAARGDPGGLRHRRAARLRPRARHVHRQRGDDRRRRLAPPPPRRPHPARRRRPPQPQTGRRVVHRVCCHRVRGAGYPAARTREAGTLDWEGLVPSTGVELRYGSFVPRVPVVLAPMAGVTNAPFRALCRRFGPGLVYVNEMVMATALVHGNAKTERMITFDPDERPRSLQVYGSDPEMMGRAVARVCDAGLVDHIDLNFGCPAAKVTRKGGGAAVPARPALLRAVVRAAVSAAAPYGVPVSAKFRIGLHDGLITHLRAGEICADEGVVAIAVHARTVEQHYAGDARWHAIAELKAHVTSIPVLGNGDIWEAGDAVAMMRATGCDGVVVGRGCLGRPWLFGDLIEVLEGRPAPGPRRLGMVRDVMADHAAALVEHLGGESLALRMFRKHASWYLTGYPVGGELRRQFSQVSTLAELDDLLAALDPATTVVDGGERIRRGHTNGPIRVSLPDGFLDDPDDLTIPDDSDVLALSGG